jgi:hypothetical protein
MTGLLIAAVLVLIGDHAVKLLLPRVIWMEAVPLGPLGNVRMVAGQLWMQRLSRYASGQTLWGFWIVAAAALLIASQWVPSASLFIGLLLGGSLSNMLESSRRGRVSDYVCLRFWPPFNLADLALAIGAVGTLFALVVAVRGLAS